MPGSLARKERRRKEREGNPAPVTPKTAYVESVDDEGGPHGGAVQAAEEMQPYHTIDIPISNPVRERSNEPQPQPSPQQAAHQLLMLDGQGALVRSRACQKQSKSRSKRAPPPWVLRESEPPFGSLYSHPSICADALRQLRNLTPDESERLKHAVMTQMTEEGSPLPVESRPDGAQGVSIPIGSITPPLWTRSTRDKDVITKDEAENPRQALFDRLEGTSEQVAWPVPMAKAVKEVKASASPVLQSVSGSVDGASQSVEIVTPEMETLAGEQPSVEEHTGGDEELSTDIKLQTEVGSGESAANLADKVAVEAARDSLGDTPTKNTLPATEPIAHPEDIARIDNLTKKLRQSLESARIEVYPVQEGVVLHHGITHGSSSSDYASSSGDSGAKLNVSRTRRIANDGILELKASPFKIDPAKLPPKEHRRKVSLKLPVNASKPQLSYPRLTAYHAHNASLSTDEGVLSSFDAEERELEYKHRHIFIGTASLDDFLEILEVTPAPAHTTTKSHVVKAFGILACAEQMQARQCSLSPEDWNFVTRTTPDNVLTRTDYLTESHIKLGSITLGKFLAKIPFDGKAEITAIKVVEAFCLASHLDAEATYGSQSKAKAFRSWLVKGNAAKSDS